MTAQFTIASRSPEPEWPALDVYDPLARDVHRLPVVEREAAARALASAWAKYAHPALARAAEEASWIQAEAGRAREILALAKAKRDAFRAWRSSRTGRRLVTQMQGKEGPEQAEVGPRPGVKTGLVLGGAAAVAAVVSETLVSREFFVSGGRYVSLLESNIASWVIGIAMGGYVAIATLHKFYAHRTIVEDLEREANEASLRKAGKRWLWFTALNAVLMAGASIFNEDPMISPSTPEWMEAIADVVVGLRSVLDAATFVFGTLFGLGTIMTASTAASGILIAADETDAKAHQIATEENPDWKAGDALVQSEGEASAAATAAERDNAERRLQFEGLVAGTTRRILDRAAFYDLLVRQAADEAVLQTYEPPTSPLSFHVARAPRLAE